MPQKNYTAITVKQAVYDRVKAFVIKTNKETGQDKSILSFTEDALLKAIGERESPQ